MRLSVSYQDNPILNEREQIEQAISAQEGLRATLGDAVVDATIAVLRDRLDSLAADDTPEQRKLATVLFCDLVGSTPMAEKMDPEDVRELLNRYFEPWKEAIARHNGMVDKFIGDAVMALYGIPVASEQDAENAIRTALDVREGLETLNDELEQKYSVRLQIRVGINTGLVLVGSVGREQDYTVTGDTVNLSARLEHAAPTNGILISHDTYRHVRGIFDIEELEPIDVKGKSEPIRVYVVERAKPRAFRMETRGVEGIDTQMIGREVQLQALQEAFHAVTERQELQVITLIGDAGVGKSRLIREFETWADLQPDEFYYFKGRASQEMQNVPYALLRDLLGFRFQILDSDEAATVREKVERGFTEALADDDGSTLKAHFVGQLLGFDFSASPHLQGVLDDAQQIHDRGVVYLSEFLQAMTGRLPVLLLMEDIHWADDSSLDTVNRLVSTAAVRGQPALLLIAAARPSLLERRPDWAEGQDFHNQKDLAPLSRQDSQRLVTEVLQKVEAVPDSLRDLVVNGAEGNPFYVEELIKMLLEDGVIIAEEEQWRVVEDRVTTVRIPPTLTGVLQARLDSLPPADRSVLQKASVMGELFWEAAVAHVTSKAADDIDSDAVPSALSALQNRELIFRMEASAFGESAEFTFKQALLRDVTYEGVLKRVRREYHGLVAAWLMDSAGEREGEVVGTIADHLELAGRNDEAVVYLKRAGQQAMARYANEEAVEYFTRALALTPKSEATERYDLLSLRYRANDPLGKREAQAQDLESLEIFVESLDDDGKRTVMALRKASLDIAHQLCIFRYTRAGRMRVFPAFF